MAREYADNSALPSGWRTRQPGMAIWILVGLLRGVLQAIFYSIWYIPRSSRQNPTWTYRQAFMSRVFECAFVVITDIGFAQSLTLSPGKLGDRWVLIDPGPAEAYHPDFSSKSIKPARIGGTWYPALPEKASLVGDEGLIVLAFHSGSLLWLTGRPDDSGPIAKMLNRKLGNNTFSFWVQYRLGGGNDPTPYPGAMQDAVTAYFYLVKKLGISPSRIVLAGDSTGSTIAVGLLRYLASIDTADHALAGLATPKACLLFSPSVEYSFEGDAEAIDSHRNIKTDYVDGKMLAWGARALAPPDSVRLDDPYLSPALHPFATPVPIFAQAGGAEVLCDTVRGFADRMSGIPTNKIEYLEVPGVPHDIYATGAILGWPKEQAEIHEAAAKFVHDLGAV
ncbi:Alpha/beta hydrolase fold-3 [Penicillium chermesinum]|uniref:Alpha/beta hydrolase fold-3 n=1 Tax=Penicillium chermesinum TaxID=63820 RepID=A0A9W9NGJ7_9EURO|nr:Alpha/beta hydrolase fold-3 [Penicillium chermesinum]KAJ5219582.1 Alpha/beta hydrolase fold-3 [Penicillium chermesinum]KAJ6153596.1 Alpha/beta hydrolase fold-3 [Penicillium chermesinum]